MNIVALSRKRVADAQAEYGDEWKTYSKERLWMETEQELADIISYMEFYEKNFNVFLLEHKRKVVALHEELKAVMQPMEQETKKV